MPTKASAKAAPKGQTKATTERERLDRIALWAAHNRGVQSRIAAEMRPVVTPQFVHHVLMGRRKSKGYQVERKLREAGAPI